MNQIIIGVVNDGFFVLILQAYLKTKFFLYRLVNKRSKMMHSL